RSCGRATRDARPGAVLGVRTGQPAPVELRAACRLPEAVPARPCDPGSPGLALLAPLLPKTLDQFLSLSLADLDQPEVHSVSVPFDDGRSVPPRQVLV